MMSVLSGRGGGYYTCIDSARGGGGTTEASGVAGAAELSPSALEIDLFEEPLFTPLEEDASARAAQQGCVEEQDELLGSSTVDQHQVESRSNSHESTVPSLPDLLTRTSTSRQPCTREGSSPEQQETSAPAATQPTTSGLLLEDNDDFWTSTTASSSSNTAASSSLTEQQKQDLFAKLTGANQKVLSGVISTNLFEDDSEDDQEHVSVSKQASAASVYGSGAAPDERQKINQGGSSAEMTLKELIEREYSTGRTTSGKTSTKKLLDPAQLCPSNGSAKTDTTYTSTAIGYQTSDCSASAISTHSVSASQDPSGRREKFLSGASLFTDHSGDDDRQLMLGTSFCSEGGASASGSGGNLFSSEGSLVAAGGTTAVVTSPMQNSNTISANQQEMQQEQQQLCDSTSSCGLLDIQSSSWARTITPASTAAKSCSSAEELPEFSGGTSTDEVVKQQEKEPKEVGD
ncbi:unnamed protein product [Amoebophrya sp. A120]|nr:unnamed protein product [Amoebophrya sp. A120]|eukprot:GSA120T00019664001.1